MGYKVGSEWRKWDLHLHTASSYDYDYNADNSDELLCKALRENNISAVAITDHFRIDSDRIENLRRIAPDIIFFPGVELRTDKGANNIHVILIFSNKLNLIDLENDFKSIMIRLHAKPKPQDTDNIDNDSIYWDYNDIINFAKNKNAIITVHAGNKTNGVDDKIENNNSMKMAIKEEYSETVDIFEVNRLRDIDDYNNKVFKKITERPVIICSDNHDPREYKTKESLWLKCDLTFEGLKQCIYHPSERVFIGDKPITLSNAEKSPRKYIKSISINRVANPKNSNHKWFNINIPINIGLTSIIGNKGSGKSALADIIAYTGNANTMKFASFLNNERFNKHPYNFSSDYESTLMWLDSETHHKESLCNNDSGLENIQYLPQKYIEKLCNELDSSFKDEISNVIFSYLDEAKKINTNNMEELISKKSRILENQISEKKDLINKINQDILDIELKLTTEYKNNIKQKLDKKISDIERHKKNKPEEIMEPKEKNDIKKQIEKLEGKKKTLEEVINNININLAKSQEEIINLELIVQRIEGIEYNIEELNYDMKAIKDTRNDDNNLAITSNTLNVKEFLLEKIELNKKDICKLEDSLDINKDTSLTNQLEQINEEISEVITEADQNEKMFYQYKENLKNWENDLILLEGSTEKTDSKVYLENEYKYLQEQIDLDYNNLLEDRKSITESIYLLKVEKVSIYNDIYEKPKKQIGEIIGQVNKGYKDGSDEFIFKPEINIIGLDFFNNIFDGINKNFGGQFSGNLKASEFLERLIKETDFDDRYSTLNLITEIYTEIYSDQDKSHKKMKNPKEFLNYLYSLDYLDATYNLKVGEKNLTELSPGERGIILLIFYLALSQDNIPIIIDQPEDNLDNQSVYSKLVDCIKFAKKRRQLIIVTHNPNIAVACDAEQIIHCNLDKRNNEFYYTSGSIENLLIKNKVVDILEGTEPAFNLRKLKYNI